MTFSTPTFRARLGLVLASIFLVAASSQAQPKIAYIDLKKVFDSYWKTKQADANLKDRASDFDKARKGMVDDYQKANDEYKKLIESANDQAVSADEREKRKKSAESKLLEIKEIENSVNQFDRQSRTTLGEQQRRMRDNILREIREVINTKAKAGTYTVVLDVAAESANQTPVLLYTNGSDDLTEGVLGALEATKPADLPKGSDTPIKPAEKKDAK